jgi:hypothetical protein
MQRAYYAPQASGEGCQLFRLHPASKVVHFSEDMPVFLDFLPRFRGNSSIIHVRQKRCPQPIIDGLALDRYRASMGRPRRAAEGGFVYHVLNLANARMRIVDDGADYETFEKFVQ